VQHLEPYQKSGPQSTSVETAAIPEESFEEWLARSSRAKRQASYALLLDELAKLPPEESTPCTPPHTALPCAGGHLVEPSTPADSFSMFRIAPGLPGLVIKHINGENVSLPRNVHEWKKSDKIGFLNHSPLADLGKSSTLASVTILKNDVKVRQRTTNSKANGNWVGGKRKAITGMSRKSMSALKETARNVTGLSAMLTLTYPAEFPCNGKIVKNHLALIRKWLTYRGIGAFWFLEFQRRGAPHFHLFTTATVEKQDLSEAWYKIVGSGDEKHLRAGTKVELIRKPHAIASYAAKYASKAEQKEVPEGYEEVGRFWGNFGGVKVVPVDEEKGTIREIAPLVRVIKKLDKVNRQRLGLPVKTRKGRVGFTSYNTSEAIQKYLLWQVPF